MPYGQVKIKTCYQDIIQEYGSQDTIFMLKTAPFEWIEISTTNTGDITGYTIYDYSNGVIGSVIHEISNSTFGFYINTGQTYWVVPIPSIGTINFITPFPLYFSDFDFNLRKRKPEGAPNPEDPVYGDNCIEFGENTGFEMYHKITGLCKEKPNIRFMSNSNTKTFLYPNGFISDQSEHGVNGYSFNLPILNQEDCYEDFWQILPNGTSWPVPMCTELDVELEIPSCDDLCPTLIITMPINICCKCSTPGPGWPHGGGNDLPCNPCE